MNFYKVENLEQGKYKEAGLPIGLMAKVFETIGKNNANTTMNDIMGRNLILLQKENGEFTNPSGSFKDKGELLQYALIAPGQEFSLTHDGEEFKGKIINTHLIIAREKDFKELIEKEVAAFKDLTPSEMEVIQWLEVGEVGSSSLALCAGLYPQFIGKHHKLKADNTNVPHDPDDLSRCLKFLDAVPEAREKLENAKGISPQWAILIEKWTQLEQFAEDKDSQAINNILKSKKPKISKHDLY